MHALHEDCVRLAIAARDWQREAAAPPEVPRSGMEVLRLPAGTEDLRPAAVTR